MIRLLLLLSGALFATGQLDPGSAVPDPGFASPETPDSGPLVTPDPGMGPGVGVPGGPIPVDPVTMVTDNGGPAPPTPGTISGGGSGGGSGPIMPPLPPFPDTGRAPQAIHHVGSAYNLLKGNPDGQFWSTGGEDPGLSLTRKVLAVGSGASPPEVVTEHHDGCQYSHGLTLFHSTKTYQEKLMNSIKTPGNAVDKKLLPYAFTLSSGYQAVSQQASRHHYVFQDDSIQCKLGHIRYVTSLVAKDRFPVSREFAQAVCSLPTVYAAAKYMQFIDDWGTHIMTEATIGKVQTRRYEAPLRRLFNYVMFNVSDEISKGGPIYGYPESYVIDLNSYKYRHEYKYILGTFDDALSIGDMYNADIIEKTLETIDTALDEQYWQYMSYFVSSNVCGSNAAANLAQWRANVVQALGEYPAFKQATAPPDQPLAMPVTWPLGTYSVPKPRSGCPTGFVEGAVSFPQETHGGTLPSGLHMDGSFTSSRYSLSYCTKEDPNPTAFDLYWPRGDYCMLQYDALCPLGFKNGYMKLRHSPSTRTTGIVPTGTYQDSHVVMNFCCRNDTVYTHQMYLPQDKPFYLLRNQHGCQKIVGMTSSEETVTFYNDIGAGGSSSQNGLSYSYPYVKTFTGVNADLYELHYCYYTAITK